MEPDVHAVEDSIDEIVKVRKIFTEKCSEFYRKIADYQLETLKSLLGNDYPAKISLSASDDKDVKNISKDNITVFEPVPIPDIKERRTNLRNTLSMINEANSSFNESMNSEFSLLN